jgi:hypothetical protein
VHRRLISYTRSRIVHADEKTSMLAFQISMRGYVSASDNVAEEVLIQTLENMQAIRPNT